MKKLFGKRQVLLAALVVALGVAVYLNYYFASSSPADLQVGGDRPGGTTASGGTTTRGGNLGDSQFVNATTADDLPVSAPTAADTGSAYFKQARENRVTARAQSLEILQDLLGDVKCTDAMRAEITAKTEAIASAVEQESKIESLIKAKGFADCVVYIEAGKASIVIQADGLTPQQTLQITEIVTDQSQVKSEEIKLVPVKG